MKEENESTRRNIGECLNADDIEGYPDSNDKLKSYKFKKTKSFFCHNLVAYFHNFCDNTSIHGYKFLGEKNRNLFEKVFWFGVILGAIYASTFLSYKTYKQWISSPIVVTFANTETPIWKIPFPAITICPEVNVDPTYFNYTDVYEKYRNNITTTGEEDEQFKVFSLTCNDNLDFINETETKYMPYISSLELFTGFADANMPSCKWMGNEISCYKVWSLIKTSEGVCNTFNMLQDEEIYLTVAEMFEERKANFESKLWSPEKGYPPDAGLDVYPRRTIISGINGGLQIDIDTHENFVNYFCSEVQGYKVSIHHPAEAPNMDRFFRVPLDQVVVSAIRPKMITTSEEIKAYPPEIRKCYVPGEKNLTMFRVYTQHNCIYECITKFSEKECGCVPYYLTGTNLNLCGAGSKKCLRKAKAKFFQQQAILKLHNNNNDDDNSISQCNCLPACTSVEFDCETSQTDWDWRKKHKVLNNKSDAYYSQNYRSRLVLYYKDLQFMTSERHELYGTIEFLANCGGLLGLCCGFSCISLMEIISYLTLRLYSNIYSFGCKHWSGSNK